MSLDSLKKSDSSSPSRSRAWLLPVALIIGFILVFLLLFGKKLLPATEVNTAPAVTLRLSTDSTAAAQPSNPTQLLFQATGWIEPAPYTIYVPTLTDGIVETVHILEGETVKKGQLLATLIQDDAKLDLEQASEKSNSMQARIHAHCAVIPIVKSELDSAGKQVTALNEELKELKDRAYRLSKLSKSATSQQSIIQAKLRVTRQQALIEQAQAKIPQLQSRLEQVDLERQSMESNLKELKTAQARAQLALDRTEIKSPMDGVVLELHAAPGKKRLIMMDDPHSAEIAELYNPDKLQARIDVPLTEAAALSVGQPVTMTSDLLSDQTFTGRVTRITGQADIQRNTLQVKVAIENPDHRLRPGMLVRGKFYPNQQPSNEQNNTTTTTSSNRLSIFVPTEALFEVNGSNAKLWTISPDNTAQLETVTITTQTKDNHTQVTEGIRSGQKIILPPFTDIEQGTRVTTQKS